MGRFIMAGALISAAALGSVLALPVTAQAATPDLNGGGSWVLNSTYPDTPAGLAACNAEGRYLVTTYHTTDETYVCEGSYQLWIYFDPYGF
jgi:hypothetical protein